MYEYNAETNGICTIKEFMMHDCEHCPKRGLCEEIVKRYEERKNENSNRSSIPNSK